MSTDTQQLTSSASAAIIDEIYALMGRKRINQVALGARIGRPQPWVNRRLMGHTEMTIPELEAIAEALGLTLWDLLARASEGWAPRGSNPQPTGLRPGGDASRWWRRRAKRVLYAHPHNHPALAGFPKPRQEVAA